jgi:GAF domain-containing protein
MIDVLKNKLKEDQLIEVLDNLLHQAMIMNQTKAGTLRLINKKNNTLEIASSSGLSPDFIENFKIVTCDDGSVCGRALQEKETIFIQDLTTDKLFAKHLNLALRNNIFAVRSTPLISSLGNVIGIISVHFNIPRKLSKNSIEEMESFCQKAADKIEELIS